MKIIAGSSAARDPDTLVTALIAGVGWTPDFVSIHASATTDLPSLRDGVLSHTGASRVHGATSWTPARTP
jgi:hypothetical protein